MDEIEFPKLVQELYATVDKLTAMFPKRRFTLDGHLVGSLGEVIAEHYYGVTLYPASTEGHDGHVGGMEIEIKTTQNAKVSLSSGPKHLLVFKLLPDGAFEEHYNGPGGPVWQQLVNRKPAKRAQHQISLFALKALMAKIHPAEMLPLCKPLPVGTKLNPCSSAN